MGLRELIQSGRQIQLSRTTGILVVVVVIALVLLSAYLIYGPSTPSPAEVKAAQTETADKFAKWVKAREEAKRQAGKQRLPYSNAPTPAGR